MHDEVDGRVSVPIEVAYDSDIEKVKNIIRYCKISSQSNGRSRTNCFTEGLW